MKTLSFVSDSDLLAVMPSLVLAERARAADVIEHLVEIERRRLYLDQACSSLFSYCKERLAYSEDEALQRARVARLASRFPQALDELRAGAIHLTGLFLLSRFVTDENAAELFCAARHKSKLEIKQLIAERFPKPDIPARICPQPEQLAAPVLVAPATAEQSFAWSGPGGKVEPLSASRFSVQFTASGELREKIERASELLSHVIPPGDLPALFERALDVLIEQETKRRLGAGKPRKHRPTARDSRHIPLEVARIVWERDGNQCSFVDADGRRCSARHYLTIEHRDPHAMQGPPTPQNLCLLCSAHNQHAAREVFGEDHIEKKRAESNNKHPQGVESNGVIGKVHSALRNMGFSDAEARRALAALGQTEAATDVSTLLRAALGWLVPSKVIAPSPG